MSDTFTYTGRKGPASDIIERLQKVSSRYAPIGTCLTASNHDVEVRDLLLEAKDDIERLRAVVDKFVLAVSSGPSFAEIRAGIRNESAKLASKTLAHLIDASDGVVQLRSLVDTAPDNPNG